jgi:hypothetical protein
MDIGELLKLADNAFSQVKRVSAYAEDANAVMSNLTGFAGQLGELKKALTFNDLQELHQKSTSSKKPEQSSTEKAMQIYTAKVRLRQMEQELYHMFLYGDLNHLGMDGYKEFCKIREGMEMEAKKVAEQEQAWALNQEADEEFLKQLKIIGGAAFASIGAVLGVLQQIKDLLG